MSESFNDLYIEQYTEKSIVVRGDTIKYKYDLKVLGGKYNANLRDSPGWIFPKTSEKNIKNFISQGIRKVSEEIPNNYQQSISIKDKSNKELIEQIQSMKKDIDYLKNEVYKLIQLSKPVLKNTQNNQHLFVIAEDEDEDEDEIHLHRRRLLK